MKVSISIRLNDILNYAREEAMRTGSYAISVDHLTLGLLRDADNDACTALRTLGIDTAEMKDFIDSQIFCDRSVPYGESAHVAVSRGAESAINMAAFEALKSGQEEVQPQHLLVAITRTQGNAGATYLSESGITTELVAECLRDQGAMNPMAVDVTPSAPAVSHIILSSNQSKTFS